MIPWNSWNRVEILYKQEFLEQWQLVKPKREWKPTETEKQVKIETLANTYTQTTS